MNKGVDEVKLVLQRVGRQTPHGVKDLDMAVQFLSEVLSVYVAILNAATSEHLSSTQFQRFMRSMKKVIGKSYPDRRKQC